MLINLKTKTQVTEQEFRALHPRTCFPKILKDETILSFGYAILNGNQTKPTITRYQRLISAEPIKIGNKWEAQYSVVNLSNEEITLVDAVIHKEIVNGTQKRLDNFAQERGYDNVNTVSKFNGSKNPRYASDCIAICDAATDTWDALFLYQADVIAGRKPKPTGYADVEPFLPTLIWLV